MPIGPGRPISHSTGPGFDISLGLGLGCQCQRFGQGLCGSQVPGQQVALALEEEVNSAAPAGYEPLNAREGESVWVPLLTAPTVNTSTRPSASTMATAVPFAKPQLSPLEGQGVPAFSCSDPDGPAWATSSTPRPGPAMVITWIA